MKRTIKLQIWDTAGQRNFRSITRSYYRGAAGLIVAFDVTNRSTFESVESWVQEIRRFSPDNCSILLLGTKTDFEDRRVVTREEAEREAKKHNLLYLEASAKTGLNVNLAFETLATDVLKKVRRKVFDVKDRNGVKIGIRDDIQDAEEKIQDEHQQTDDIDRYTYVINEMNEDFELELKGRSIKMSRTLLFKDCFSPPSPEDFNRLRSVFALEKVDRETLINFCMINVEDVSSILEKEGSSEESKWIFFRDYYILFKLLGLKRQIFLLYHIFQLHPIEEIGFGFLNDMFNTFIQEFENENVKNCFLRGLSDDGSTIKESIEEFFDHSFSVLLFQVLFMMWTSILEGGNEKPTGKNCEYFEKFMDGKMDLKTKEEMSSSTDIFKKHEDVKDFTISLETVESSVDELEFIKDSFKKNPFQNIYPSEKKLASPPNLELTTKMDGKCVRVHKEVMIMETNFFYRMMHFKGQEYTDIMENGRVVIEELSSLELGMLIDLVYTGNFINFFESHKKEEEEEEEDNNVHMLLRTALKLFCFISRFQEVKIMKNLIQKIGDILESKSSMFSFSSENEAKIHMIALMVELGHLMDENVAKILGTLFENSKIIFECDFKDLLYVSRLMKKNNVLMME